MSGITDWKTMHDLVESMKNVNSYESAVKWQGSADAVFNPPSNKKKNNDPWLSPGQEDNNQASVNTSTDFYTVDPWAYGASLFLGLPGIIAAGAMAAQQGQPIDTNTTISGISEDTATKIFDTTVDKTTETTTTDMLSGLGSTVDLIVKFLPILLIVGLFTSIKKVF